MTAPFDRAPAKTQQRTLPPTLHHKTLSAYYPYIYTLSQFISSRLEDFESQLHTSNTTAFSTFLTSTLCAFRNEDELNRVELDKDRRVIFPTQQEAIDKALSHVAKASSGPGKVQNLLLLRTSSSVCGNQADPKAILKFMWTVVAHTRSTDQHVSPIRPESNDTGTRGLVQVF